MDSPYSAPKPPKTITQVKDDRFLDFTCLHTWILTGAILSILYLFNAMARSIDNKPLMVLYVALLLAVVTIWAKNFATFDQVEKRKLKVLFFIDGMSGNHVINNFSSPVSFLEKLVPLVAVHENGVIEFKDNQFGTLMETHPLRISEEERPKHERKIEKIINGIPTNLHFKTIACSRLEPRKPILRYLLEIAAHSNGDLPTDLHLAGIYNKIAGDNSPTISWKYYAFISLGEWKTVSETQIQFGAIIPGLLENMNTARLLPKVYTSEKEIGNAYRTMFNEMVI